MQRKEGVFKVPRILPMLLKIFMLLILGGWLFSNTLISNPSEVSFDAPAITSSTTQSKVAALTFDDGPDTLYTAQILDILKRYKIKATFFVVGQRAKAYPKMISRIVREGHALGNHSWDHANFSKLSPQEARKEIIKADQVLDSITGHHSKIFRPPYGAVTPDNSRAISAMGYKIINWSVDTRDWAGTQPQEIMRIFNRQITPGGIILQHCSGGKSLNNTIVALEQIIASLQSKGYRFVTIPELLSIR
jgi:peptidoglycan/xylan/chitin deacetylase (PgdA/CDA1 family)